MASDPLESAKEVASKPTRRGTPPTPPPIPAAAIPRPYQAPVVLPSATPAPVLPEAPLPPSTPAPLLPVALDAGHQLVAAPAPQPKRYQVQNAGGKLFSWQGQTTRLAEGTVIREDAYGKDGIIHLRNQGVLLKEVDF